MTKKRKYYRKCGVCGGRYEQSEMIRDNCSPSSTDCYFDECGCCEFQECNNDAMICIVNRLGLAFHRLLMDIPLINKLIDGEKYCHWFVKKR